MSLMTRGGGVQNQLTSFVNGPSPRPPCRDRNSVSYKRGAFHSRSLKFLDEEADDSGDGFSASILASWYSKMVLRWTYEG